MLPLLMLSVPLFLLLASAIVMFGADTPRFRREKLAAFPIGLAFLGSVLTLYLVTGEGPIIIRFYNPDSAASLIIPLGFYVDRLSAVMMTLITAVSMLIYIYSTTYMYQDGHARRYLSLICLTDFVLICMVSSSNLMMLFLFWQLSKQGSFVATDVFGEQSVDNLVLADHEPFVYASPWMARSA